MEQQLRNSDIRCHSDATDIPSLDDLQISFLQNCDLIDKGGSNQPARQKGSMLRSVVHYFWRKFDDKFMRPIFGGQGFVPFVPFDDNWCNRSSNFLISFFGPINL